MQQMKQFYKKLIPHLDVWLDIGIVQVKTELWNYCYDRTSRQYITLRVTLFYKWGFHFRLYSPR